MPYPLLFQVQTRDTLYRLSKTLNLKATLADIPDQMLDEWKALGFDWIWLLGVWETGTAGREMSRTRPGWQKEFHETLPDLKTEDITGSCFAIKNYTVHPDLGGTEALEDIRNRLHDRGMKLMLDFVPNHTAPDHPWLFEHPEFFIRGSVDDLNRAPENFQVVEVQSEKMIFAHGRDPNFPGWQDTLQLDYANPQLQDAMIGELLNIAGQCDGLRCDMSMLLLPDIFQRTWGRSIQPFWPAGIHAVRDRKPDFLFLAEVYWDLEWEMQQQGFDYCYDKRLYDRLEHPDPNGIRQHLWAGMDYQERLTRFLENHDEPRAATTFPGDMHLGAALITYFSPGMKFFHQGQPEGYKVRIPVHLNRGPVEHTDPLIHSMYQKIFSLLKEPVFREGYWQLLDARLPGEVRSAESVIVYRWDGTTGQVFLVVVNFSSEPVTCMVGFHQNDQHNLPVKLHCRLSGKSFNATHTNDGHILLSLTLKAWESHLFEVQAPKTGLG